VRCFQNVAEHLSSGSVFVVESFVPDMTRFDQHQRVSAIKVERDSAQLEISRHDPVAQRSESLHVMLSEDGVKLYPVTIRYAWPAELDLMAKLAGLSLRDRFGSWRREPFTSSSTMHVSIYELSE
jgi:hypothetical protein